MNDDQLRSELERRSSAGMPDEHLVAAIRPSLLDAAPRRSWRLAPIGGLAAAVAIVVLVVATLPSLAPPGGPSPSTASPGDSGHTNAPVDGRRIECSRGSQGNSLIGAPAIVDLSGRVESCQLVDPGRGIPDAVVVTNPDPNLGELHVKWSGTPCDAASVFTLRETSVGWELDGQRPSVDCDASLVPHAMRIALSEPIDATTVTASLPLDGLEPSLSPNPSATTFECVGPPLPPEATPDARPTPTVIDETGLVIGCGQSDTITDLAGAISVSNPVRNSLHVMWVATGCDRQIVFTFRESGDGYELVGSAPETCDEESSVGSVQIMFSQPMPAENVQATLAGYAVSPPIVRPTPEAPVVECSDSVAEIGAVVVDPTGVVDSCTTVEPTQGLDPDQYPSVANPGGDTGLLQIQWSGSPCHAAVAWTLSDAFPNQDRAFPVWLLSVGPRPDGQHLGGELDDGTLVCIMPLRHHAILLDLNTEIDANTQIELADPATAPPSTGVVNHECGDDIATFGDRTGKVLGCSIATDRGVPSTDATIGERDSLVSLAWPVMLDNACQPLPSVVTAWGPVAGLSDENYVVQVTTLAISSGQTLPGGGVCDAATGMHYLDLTVEDQANWDIVHQVETSPTRLTSSSGVEVDVGSFGLTLTSPGRTFAANEPIVGIGASLHYDGGEPVTMSGLVRPLLSFRQLGGELFLRHAMLAICPRNEQEVTSGVPVQGSIQRPTERASVDPNNAYYDEFMYDGKFRLPPGTYQVSAFVGAYTAPGCGGESVDLGAAIVISVR